jgi:hypothetical protein
LNPTSEEQLLSQISSVYPAAHILKSDLMSVKSSTKQNKVNATTLPKRWSISLAHTEQVLSTTTQHFIRSSVNPLERIYRNNIQQLRYRHLTEPHGRLDTMFSSIRSANGHTCGQIFVKNIGFYHFTPMNKELEASNALVEFIQHVGIPSKIHTDGSKVQSKGNWAKTIKSYHIKHSFTEPHSPWQNRAEGAIKELKRHTSRLIQVTNSPKRLWDYCCLLVT